MSNRNKQNGQIAQPENNPPSPGTLVSVTGIRIGPLPSPAEMEKYEQLYPGATKMLFELFKEQSGHRMELEKTVIKGDSRRANIAQWLSFALGMTALTGGVILILKGKDGFGFASIIGALTTLLSAFIGGAILRKIERQNKAKAIKK
ncbi:MAG: DUF2335 domain-containing protein [Spirochaetales bacterium]|jgi:uncharacterized membrane protein|nr:DUF2335 domain-containing protein [Spirochaetales bacterium]